MVENGSAPTLSLAYLRAGPFISGTTHAVLQLGQQPRLHDSGPFAAGGPFDADGGQVKRPSKPDRVQPKKRGRASVTLKDLVDNGILSPGKGNVTVAYKGITHTASLLKDGLIQFQGLKFSSATAFSMHCKRLQTPNKQGDDGWKSVLYEGTPLDVFRKKYEANRHAGTPRPGEDAEKEESEVAASEDGAPQAAGAPTDQWVQCDRCKTWRVVPPEQWPAVEADDREEWLCEYATWAVVKYAPFKPACSTGGRTSARAARNSDSRR